MDEKKCNIDTSQKKHTMHHEHSTRMMAGAVGKKSPCPLSTLQASGNLIIHSDSAQSRKMPVHDGFGSNPQNDNSIVSKKLCFFSRQI